MTVLVTGAAGFIGSHLSHRLLSEGYEVIGIDNLNDYYDVDLKLARLERLQRKKGFSFEKGELESTSTIDRIFQVFKPKHVVNLAAQAGVRYSIENPQAYVDSNITGFLNILNACRDHKVEHLIYASSSSVYGDTDEIPFSVDARVDTPVSIYAASKLANELMAHVYFKQFGMNLTGLRFFTVYGPWGRPDMSAFLFVKAILDDKPIKLFNGGNHRRDFTYVDDIVEGITRIVDQTPAGEAYRRYNIGRGAPVDLGEYVAVIEKELGKQARKEILPMQLGDVEETWADVTPLFKDYGYKPVVDIEQGISSFVDWYRDFYQV